MRFKRLLIASIIPLLAVVAVLMLLGGGRVQAAPDPHLDVDANPDTTIEAPHAQTSTVDCQFVYDAWGVIPVEYNEEKTEGNIYGYTGGDGEGGHDPYVARISWYQDESCEDIWPFSPNIRRLHIPIVCTGGDVESIKVKQGLDMPMAAAYCPAEPMPPYMRYQIGEDDDGDGEADWTDNFIPNDEDHIYQTWAEGAPADELIWIGGDADGTADEHTFQWYIRIVEVNGVATPTDTEEITDCVPIESVVLDGPTQTVIGSWNDYQATVFPSFATTGTGFNIDWEATGGDSVVVEDGDHADIVWYYTGIQTVTVSAANMCSYRTAWMTTVVTNTFIPPISVTLPISPGAMDCSYCEDVEGEWTPTIGPGLWGTLEDWVAEIYNSMGLNSLRLMCYFNCYMNYALSWGGYAIDLVGYYIGTALNGFAEWLWWTFQPAIQCLFSWFTNAAHYVRSLNVESGNYLQAVSDELTGWLNSSTHNLASWLQNTTNEMVAWLNNTTDNMAGWLVYEDGMLASWLNDTAQKLTAFFSSLAGFLRSMVRLGLMIAAWITSYFFGLIAKLIGYVNFGVTLVSELVRGFRDAIAADSEADWKTKYSGLYYFWRGLTYFEDTAGAGPLAILNLFSLGIIGIRLFFWTIGQVNDFMEDIARW